MCNSSVKKQNGEKRGMMVSSKGHRNKLQFTYERNNPMIRVSASELIAKANELKNLNSQFKGAISELETAEETLRTMWEGEANDAFHTAFTNDKIQMTNFYNAIEVYIYRLLEIAAKYQQAEATNTDIASTRTYH